MPFPICTIDSSCIIALDHLRLIPQLSFLFSRVLLPKAVRNELFKRRDTKDRLQALLNDYAFLERCDDYDKTAVDILLIERAVQGVKDRGEAEAVVQASEKGATVIVDDRWGRELAGNFGREFHGTFWILQQFVRLGLLSPSSARSHFLELYQQDARLPWDAVNAFLADIGEAPLT
jgi:predicted nucleic acid-binding protein